MKQFNLEEYLANPSKKVVTRDGRNVRIICTDRVGIFPIIGLISSDSIADFEEIVWYTKEGVCDSSTEKCHDLFFASQKYEGWLNVYRHTDTEEVTFGAILHTSREEAEKIGRADEYYAATAKVEWEE